MRPDIFATGYFSMFDVILAIADKNGIELDFHYDSTRKTHWIDTLNGKTGNFWYHFSYDAGSGNQRELEYKRQHRWDEALWRPGVWVAVSDYSDLEDLKAEYLEEINRESDQGNVIPFVGIMLNPTDYQGNTEGSGRITVSRSYTNVLVKAHNLRSAESGGLYSKPFQPGVKTSMDILLSLADQGELTVVTGAFYTHFNSNYIDSYYIVEMGFPDVGIAHSSGRQGFVYTTGNGENFKLANNADNKFHMTSDISVIHAPDFSRWRWLELGSPYYESEEPQTSSIEEDYQSISRGFNLHAPYPNPVSADELRIYYNIFEPGTVQLTIYTGNGMRIRNLLSANIADLGIHEISVNIADLIPGVYLIKMEHNQNSQIRKFIILK